MPVVMIHRSSSEDATALAAAQGLSRERGDELLILATASGSRAEGVLDLEQRAFNDQLQSQLSSDTEWHAELIAPGEDPIESLVARVHALRPSTVVVGTRHRTAVGKLLFGHDLQRLLMYIEVPILLVKPAK
ncbi:universal stress protein [Nocardioides sp. NBC_00850]|uniref:universal stress protein n=1 Tax=Nocardioides sp. NBC_00850 TaxID=2976001 RepID=UPI0038660FD4|nr:universal stress protein [Nocardioides sp. NBC_00850]